MLVPSEQELCPPLPHPQPLGLRVGGAPVPATMALEHRLKTWSCRCEFQTRSGRQAPPAGRPLRSLSPQAPGWRWARSCHCSPHRRALPTTAPPTGNALFPACGPIRTLTVLKAGAKSAAEPSACCDAPFRGAGTGAGWSRWWPWVWPLRQHNWVAAVRPAGRAGASGSCGSPGRPCGTHCSPDPAHPAHTPAG